MVRVRWSRRRGGVGLLLRLLLVLVVVVVVVVVMVVVGRGMFSLRGDSRFASQGCMQAIVPAGWLWYSYFDGGRIISLSPRRRSSPHTPSIRGADRHLQLGVGCHFNGLSPSPPMHSIRSNGCSTVHKQRLSPSPPLSCAGAVCLLIITAAFDASSRHLSSPRRQRRHDILQAWPDVRSYSLSIAIASDIIAVIIVQLTCVGRKSC